MTQRTIDRRSLLLGATMLAGGLALPALAQRATDPTVLQVMKSPSCGCCGAWVELARESGFTVEVTETDDYVGMKEAAGVPEDLWSCHTARIGGYVVEGHVPFAAIRRMLAERPDIAGLSVPGMPADSPGMGGGLDAVVEVVAWGGAAGAGARFGFDAG